MDDIYRSAQAESAASARVDALVRAYQTKIARYVRRMTGDAEVALDLTQDVFLAAFRMVGRDPERPLTPGWLYKTATNNAISYLRRKSIVRMLPLERDADTRSWRIDERSAASMDLQAALAHLPAEQMAAVMLTSYAGYTSQEAAAILHTSPDAVRQRVCRAMRALRATMAERQDG